MQFQVFLDGYDDSWSPFTKETQKDYTNLDAGNYTFRVRAKNIYNTLSQEDTFPFTILPPWYQTWWANVFYVLALLSLMFLVVRWRSRKLVREKENLEGIIHQRTREIEDKSSQLEIQAEQLKELDRMKSRFFANISHEFRTPLTLIMGPLEQMLNGEPESHKEETVQMALRNSHRLLALINQLLDLSRLESGGMPLQASKLDIIPFLKGLTGSFHSLIQQKKLTLTFQTHQNELILWFDTVKLEKIIVNLIANAIKFTPAGGTITVTARTHRDKPEQYPDGYLQLSVADTGIGILPHQLPFIFDRFYQAGQDSENLHKNKGSGIGLALVKELVTLHGGEIKVASSIGENQNSGTTFTLQIPLGNKHLKTGDIIKDEIPYPDFQSAKLLKEELSFQNNPEETNGISNKKRINEAENKKNLILVVDDNADVRKFIRGPLESQYTVIEAEDGEAGIKTALKVIPDLIISDVMMPLKDGYQLCDALKKDIKTSHIPIILLTAKASEGSIVEGLETGADDYITKPFNTKILLTRIKNLINLRHNLQETIQRDMLLQPTEIAVSSMDREFMTQLMTLLEKHTPDSDFGVDQLAERLYMSRATLNRKIKALTGEPTNQFIQSYRLKRAAQLLKANFGNITEVAFEVGFSSSNYFTRCFKDKYHQPPHLFQASQETPEEL